MNNALEKISQAEKWLAEAKTLDELKQIHDIAIAAEAYDQAHRWGIDSENHAREIKFLAASMIGGNSITNPPKRKRENGSY